ncbi:hypothetical protein GUJ93_ZPchr0006g41780 [Zizania palustris]|uniref:Uncharacterized protein n=1 Tax=Zizania palustris TaxID=103762 RepID=A0A8J5TGU7_ZIZPA|nr:hypothetical protein GUJ93_ZPchr0006g41780 [Zizania palustris]
MPPPTTMVRSSVHYLLLSFIKVGALPSFFPIAACRRPPAIARLVVAKPAPPLVPLLAAASSPRVAPFCSLPVAKGKTAKQQGERREAEKSWPFSASQSSTVVISHLQSPTTSSLGENSIISHLFQPTKYML